MRDTLRAEGLPDVTLFVVLESRLHDGVLPEQMSGPLEVWFTGLAVSADDTASRLRSLLAVQSQLKAKVREARPRLLADNAMLLVDFALARPIFTVRQAERHLGVTYARANRLVGQLISAGVLRQYDDAVYDRRFTAPEVLAVLLR